MATVRFHSRTQIHTQFLTFFLVRHVEGFLSPYNVAASASAEAKGIFCVGGIELKDDVVINLSELLSEWNFFL